MNMNHRIVAALLPLVVWSTALAADPYNATREPPARSGEKLLLGFEPGEVAEFPASLKIKISEATDVEGRPYREVVFPSERYARQWSLYRGNASQGDFAAGLKLSRRPNVPLIRGIASKTTAEFANRDAVMHYFGMFTDGLRLFNTSGIHHLILPTDWSQYDLLRLDVYAQDLTLTYHLALEDEDILPPVVRVMETPPNQWTTLEIDLRAAAKERGIDLRKTTSIAVGVTGVVKGEPKFENEPKKRLDLCFALLDNIRLCRRGVQAEHPVVRDDRPYTLLPGYYVPSTEPAPIKSVPENPDRTPIKLGNPIIIDTGERVDATSRLNWVSAYDNNHLLIGFQTKTFWCSRA